MNKILVLAMKFMLIISCQAQDRIKSESAIMDKIEYTNGKNPEFISKVHLDNENLVVSFNKPLHVIIEIRDGNFREYDLNEITMYKGGHFMFEMGFSSDRYVFIGEESGNIIMHRKIGNGLKIEIYKFKTGS